MNRWIDIDTCVVCGAERQFNPMYDKKTVDWICPKCTGESVKLIRMSKDFVRQGKVSFAKTSRDCPHRSGTSCHFVSSAHMYCKLDNCRV